MITLFSYVFHIFTPLNIYINYFYEKVRVYHMKDQYFVLISGLPNLGKSDYAKTYLQHNNSPLIIIDENDIYEDLVKYRTELKKDRDATSIVINELRDNKKETESYIINCMNTKIHKELSYGNNVIAVYSGLSFRERGYIMNNISDIKCDKSLVFFHMLKSKYIEYNRKLENPLSEDEINKLFSIIDMPDNKYIEGFDRVFVQ